MMRLKVRDVDIASGGVLVAIVNKEDAKKFDLHPEDRINIKFKAKKTTAVVDIAESKKTVPEGSIGLFEEALKELDVKDNDFVEIDLAEKPSSVYFIRKKLDGAELSKHEMHDIINDLVHSRLTDIELTYFISGCFTQGMTDNETINLTKAIVKFGGQLNLKRYPIMDKHCSGGVPGNRTTMVIVPIVAAAGLTIPKTSSRSITSPAGTADTMEVLAPVSLPVSKLRRIAKKTNGFIAWGGAVDLAAADDKLIRLRNPLSLDPEGMLLSSILAKKASVNATHVLVDLPIGKETKMKTRHVAEHMKKEFIKIGKKLGMRIEVMFSEGNEPIGNGIGPALEARDVMWVLSRNKKRPLDLEKKGLLMAAKILKMAGIKAPEQKAKDILESGLAYKKMKEIIKAQGGNPNINPDKIRIGQYSYTLKSPKRGLITDIDNITINKMARVAGAPMDKGAGVYLYKHEMEIVEKGGNILTIYSDNEQKLHFALHILKRVGGIVIDSKVISK